MFSVHEDSGYHDVIEGIRKKTLVYGDPHEQTGYLVSGRIDLTIDGVVHAVRPGDSWCIPGDVAHSAVAYADSVALEVFSPVREDYLP